MAKIRVYELAKKLNLTNKAFLKKLKGMKIAAKSHMSSLEEDIVEKIKKKIFGSKKDKQNEVKIKSSVIRRRPIPKKEENPEELSEEKAEIQEDANEEKIKIQETTKKEKVQEDGKEKKIEVQKDSDSVEKEIKITSQTDVIEIKNEKTTKPLKENLEKKSKGKLKKQEKEKAGQGKKRKTKKENKKKSTPAKIIQLAEPFIIPFKEQEKPKKKIRKIITKSEPLSLAPSSSNSFPEIPPEIIPLDDNADNLKKNKKKKGKKEEEETEQSPEITIKKKKRKKRKSVIEGKDLYEKSRGGKKKRRKDSKLKKKTNVQKTQITIPKAIKRRIKIDETIELAKLAKRMGIKANEMLQKLMSMGVMVTINQTIDFDTAFLVGTEFGYEVERASSEEDILIKTQEKEIDPKKLKTRPPVVTIMGHVDHGKTSLLDIIRKSKITTEEAGGITQHIGAYSVETSNGIITFLDTPGHAAFTSMRYRGAQITDMVVLVVAADDGVMPQTIEAINHSKAANVPVLVAINKMDKVGTDPDKIIRELADHGLVSEDWGGDVIFAKVSAKAETGIDELLESILLQAEVLELKANPEKFASGHVIEARLDSGRGPVATILVREGTLKIGQPIVCGLHSGKIRIMIDDIGKSVNNITPGSPVEIVGLTGVPEAGDEFVIVASEKNAKQISEHRTQKNRAKELSKKSRANLEKLFANMGIDQIKELKLIIKADVHGSIEAINESLIKLAKEEVDIKIIHSGTGTINESDVSLAAVSNAIIIGFNVRPSLKIREIVKKENVDMRFYDIIYNLINDIKIAIKGLIPAVFHEIIIGTAEVRDIFVVPNKGTIAGSFILDGKVARGEKIRLIRNGTVKCNSTLISLRRFKDDVKEVLQNYECGIGIQKYNDIKIGDIIECYRTEEVKESTMEQSKE